MNLEANQDGCLICGNSKTQLRRGLCNSHYQKFIRAWRSVPEVNRAAFEKELIEDQLLLPAQPRGRKSKDMVFKEKASKYMFQPDGEILPADKKGKKKSSKKPPKRR